MMNFKGSVDVIYFLDKVVNPELSVRAGGSEVFPPVIKGLSPTYFDKKTTEN